MKCFVLSFVIFACTSMHIQFQFFICWLHKIAPNFNPFLSLSHSLHVNFGFIFVISIQLAPKMFVNCAVKSKWCNEVPSKFAMKTKKHTFIVFPLVKTPILLHPFCQARISKLKKNTAIKMNANIELDDLVFLFDWRNIFRFNVAQSNSIFRYSQ